MSSVRAETTATPGWGYVGTALVACVIAATACAITELPVVLRAILGLPLIAIGVGYLAAAAALPRFDGTFGERLALSIGLSLATTIISAALVYWVGDDPPTWTTPVALGCCAVLFGSTAIVRSSDRELFGSPHRSLGPIPVVPVVVVAALLAGAAAITAIGIQEEDVPQFTELSLAHPGESSSESAVSIHNEEGVELTYRLEIRCGKKLIAPPQELTIEEGGTWSSSLPQGPCTSGRLSALLWRLDRPVDEELPYRETYFSAPRVQSG